LEAKIGGYLEKEETEINGSLSKDLEDQEIIRNILEQKE